MRPTTNRADVNADTLADQRRSKIAQVREVSLGMRGVANLYLIHPDAHTERFTYQRGELIAYDAGTL